VINDDTSKENKMTANSQMKPRFHLGQIVGTPAALETIEDSGQEPTFFLDRHVHGDWGDLSDSDRQLNDEAVVDGSRIMSSYKTLKGVKIWVITEGTNDEGNRAATTILLPEEY
jgi:hypothetical protein